MYRIVKRWSNLSAAHWIEGLPEGHQCARPHGHNYWVELELKAGHTLDLQGPGFVRDYGELKEFGDWLKSVMDHQCLNETFPMLQGRTTSEHLARVLFFRAVQLYGDCVNAVRVSETDSTWAEYRT
jgi:6-pyruvoyltetrahydropterin/6-carboxytetrahydropterin synthase